MKERADVDLQLVVNNKTLLVTFLAADVSSLPSYGEGILKPGQQAEGSHFGDGDGWGVERSKTVCWLLSLFCLCRHQATVTDHRSPQLFRVCSYPTVMWDTLVPAIYLLGNE